MTRPEAIIDRLDMAAHPEGGWYAETWRADPIDGTRSAATSIVYLLREGERSHWHRVDADELWIHQAGAPMTLRIAAPSGDQPPVEHRLTATEGTAQVVVPAGWWQSAEPAGAWSMVGCVVVPGFEFAGFELAPPGWNPA